MSSIPRAIVVGAGVAGTTTAMALLKAGIESVIYEAHPGGASGVGAFLTLATNGIDALRVLDADKPVLNAGFATPQIALRSASGKPLGSTATGIPLSDGTTSQTITRPDLYEALHQETLRRGIRVEHGRRLMSGEELPDRVRAVFHEGPTEEAEILVGCDGVHSTLRRSIDPNSPAPAYSGLLTTGGYVRGVPVDMSPGSYEMIFGKRAFFGYVVAPDGQVWWFANVPHPDEPARRAFGRDSGEHWRGRLRDLFSDDAGPAVRLIDATDMIMPLTPIHTIRHLPNWHRGRAIVIGDAAHAPSPTSGQGASLSIEDALVLAKCLRDIPDHQHAFESFVRQRRPRVERIIKAAARMNSNKVAGPFAAAIRDLVLPRIMKAAAKSKAATSQFAHHIDWEIPTAARTTK